MTTSYVFTIPLVFSSSERASLIGDASAARFCRDTIILGAANTYRTRNRDKINLRTSIMVLGKGVVNG